MAFNKSACLLFLILCCLSAVPLIRLHADPMASVNFSAMQDEGRHVYAARNKALFGTWVLPEERVLNTDALKDTWMPSSQGLYFLLPHTLLVFGVFKVFGAGLLQARLLSVGEAFLAVLLLFFALRRMRGNAQAFAVSGLLASNVLFLQFARTGQTYALLFLLGALLLAAAEASCQRTGAAVWAGLLCFGIFLANGTALYLSGVWLLACLTWKPLPRKSALAFVATVTIAATAWILGYWMPHLESILPFFRESMDGMKGDTLQIGLGKLRERNLMLTFEKIPMIAYLGLVAASLELACKKRQQGNFAGWFCAVWLLIGSLAGTMLPTPHIRFCALLTIPACFLTASLLCEMEQWREAWKGVSVFRKSAAAGLIACISWVFAAHLVSGPEDSIVLRQIILTAISVLCTLAVLSSLAFSFAVKNKSYAMALILLLMLAGLGRHAWYLYRADTFSWQSMQAVRKEMGSAGKLGGGMSESLVMESRAKAVPAFILNGNIARQMTVNAQTAHKMELTHLLISADDVSEYREVMPELMEKAHLLATWQHPLVGRVFFYRLSYAK